jgi:hypothetical protein
MGAVHKARPPDHRRQRKRKRFSTAAAALPTESLAALFGGVGAAVGAEHDLSTAKKCMSTKFYRPRGAFLAPPGGWPHFFALRLSSPR